MPPLSPATTQRLRLQGFTADEAWLAEVALWLRPSPALCAAFAAIATVAASPSILFGLAVIAFLGAVMPFHPFDLIYNYGIRLLSGKRPLPPNGAPRRFGCAVATVWLVATALLFLDGRAAAGYTLGALFIAVAGLLSATDICIPSYVYGLLRRLTGGASPVQHLE
jgi:Domain of unknown function (DUF4395)